MIFKSFLVEDNHKIILNYRLILLYGENNGLISDLKNNIIKENKGNEIINIYQEDLNKNKDLLLDETTNISLFNKKKLIIINQSNDKVFDFVKYFNETENDIQILLISSLLDKKSKIRNYFEKGKNLAVIPCYMDNEISLKRIISKNLKDYKNLDTNNLNLILRYSNNSREMIYNNILKIKTFFNDKILNFSQLEELLDTDRNEMFENIRDAALMGDKNKLNELLNNYSFAKEDAFMYLNIFNSKLLKLLEILNLKGPEKSVEMAINSIKPPIFWKDKPILTNILKKWNKEEVKAAIKYLCSVDKFCKTNSNVNILTQTQNFIINLCTRTWSYF